MRAGPIFLFSIDLEDIRSLVPEGHRYADRLVANVERYLEFLHRYGMRCTFFTVGDIARRYPELVREIAAAGHEVGSHSSDHVPLNRHDRQSFREDIDRNLEQLARAGAHEVRGFRAPILSLTEKTAWAHDVLAEFGFRYSSSVLPARHPLYGWAGFSTECIRTESGLWEIPATVSRIPGFRIPFAGGSYFRVLPFAVVRRLFASESASGRPIVGYAHPYDIDTQQERFMFPEINRSPILNWMMYYNRAKVFPRLERLLTNGAKIIPYLEYVDRHLEAGERRA